MNPNTKKEINQVEEINDNLWNRPGIVVRNAFCLEYISNEESNQIHEVNEINH